MLNRVVLGSVSFVLLAAPLFAGSNEWTASSASLEMDALTDVSCAEVTGEAGAVIAFDHGVQSKSILSLGVWGARWNGSRLPYCGQFQEDVTVTDTLIHAYQEQGTSDNETLVVDQHTTPWASGMASLKNHTHPTWWWDAVVAVDDDTPEYWVFVNGSFEQQGWDSIDENTRGYSAFAAKDITPDPNTGNPRAQAVESGSDGDFVAERALPEGPGGRVEVRFPLFEVVNRDLDNVVVSNWVHGLSYDAQTAIE